MLKPFVEELVKRVNNTPFPETSEDLRLEVVKLLEKMVGFHPDAFVWYLPELANAMSKTLVDPYAEIKHVRFFFYGIGVEQLDQHVV